jgi:hypothetical protein
MAEAPKKSAEPELKLTPEDKIALLEAQLAALKGEQVGSITSRNIKAMREAERVRIVLEDNPDIPPTGLFLQYNGMPYMLRSGVEVEVPVFLLEVLDNAVTRVPIQDPQTLKVIEWRKRQRFPYREVRRGRSARDAA